MNVLAGIGREARALWDGGTGRSLIVIAGAWGLLLGTLVVAVAILTVLFAPTALALFAATAFVGVGQSLYPVARITILTALYPDRVGSALGVTMATGDLGQTVMPPIAGTIALVAAWRLGLGFMIPLLILAAIGLWVVVPAKTGTESEGDSLSTDALGDLIAELRASDMLFFIFILFLYILVWQAFTGLYPTYLAERKGLSASSAALLFSLFFACGVVVKPAAGVAYDRIDARGSLVGVLAGPVVGFGLLPIVDGIAPLIVVTALVSTMLGSGAITQSFLSEAFSEEIRGTGLGPVRTASATLGATGPVLFGLVADRRFFDEGYFVLAGLVFAVILLALRLQEERPPPRPA